MDTSSQTSTSLGDNLIERAEKRFAQDLLRRLHGRDPWTRGHFAEALVAELLEGSELAAHSAVAHDLEWHDGGRTITVAVRTTGSYSMDHAPGDGKRPFAGSWRFKEVRSWSTSTGTFLQSADGKDELRRCWADVVVLCRHDDYRIDSGWTFYVLPAAVVENWPSTTLQPRSLIEVGYLPLEAPSVSEAVRNAAPRQS